MGESRVRASIAQALASSVHWSLIVVGAAAAGITYLAHVVDGTPDLVTPVFAISGTLVALILPAASLSSQYIEPRLSYWSEELAKRQTDSAEIAGRATRAIEEIEAVVEPLWRGFVFAFISLPLSTVALFRPDLHVQSVSAEEVLVGASLGFVIVAVFSFLPFTWEILQLDLARRTRTELFDLRSLAAGIDPGPVATTTPAASGTSLGDRGDWIAD